MRGRVVIVDHDHTSAIFAEDALGKQGLQTRVFADSTADVRLAAEAPADLVLLGLAPGTAAERAALCRAFIHGRSGPPVVVLTAPLATADLPGLLALGAEDFIVKPFSRDELLVRVTTVLRRHRRSVSRLKLGRTVVDFAQLRATRGPEALAFSDLEFRLLQYLAEQEGAVVSREELLSQVWGREKDSTSRTVDQFVFRLRQKLEDDPHHPRYLRSAYGDGYRLTSGSLRHH